jgi:hypothetical protein
LAPKKSPTTCDGRASKVCINLSLAHDSAAAFQSQPSTNVLRVKRLTRAGFSHALAYAIAPLVFRGGARVNEVCSIDLRSIARTRGGAAVGGQVLCPGQHTAHAIEACQWRSLRPAPGDFAASATAPRIADDLDSIADLEEHPT